jgi:hypothetical protein
MTSQPTFLEHRAVQPLLPYQRTYLVKGMHELNAKENGGKFEATLVEDYAAQVMERVNALENCVNSLRIAMNFILDLDKDQSDATDLYQYHYENFLLRLTGILDRAYRLVGTSLRLDPDKLNKISANQFVAKAVTNDFPDLHSALTDLSDAVALHKTTRNSIAHSEAYSTRELGLFAAAKTLKLELGEINIGDLMEHYFSEGGAGLARLVAEMVSGVEALLDALAPLYETVVGDDRHCRPRGDI